MRSPRPVIAVALTATSIAILTGCGSSSSGGHPATAAAATPPVCTQISGVLGNGPDPDADPVGYAEAQIGPLATIHAANPKLATALTTLDSAFKTEFAKQASKASKAAVRRARHQVNAVCPGAAS